MKFGPDRLHENLRTGVTTIATLWDITRKDGAVFGFTDHDHDLSFGGIEYLASSGLSASAITQGLSLAVDNTEGAGALDDDRLLPEEIDAGLFDEAAINIWRINWQDKVAYEKIFSGHLGQMHRDGLAFRAEMRGHMDQLQMPMGRVYGRSCRHNLGDKGCQVDVTHPDLCAKVILSEPNAANSLRIPLISGFTAGWFANGTAKILDGPLLGQTRRIRQDLGDAPRTLTLWEPFGGPLDAGTSIELTAGCNRSFEACKSKFDNCERFGGFPFLPTEDWLIAGVGRK